MITISLCETQIATEMFAFITLLFVWLNLIYVSGLWANVRNVFKRPERLLNRTALCKLLTFKLLKNINEAHRQLIFRQVWKGERWGTCIYPRLLLK